MKLSYCKINPTGNITLIVETPVPRESQSRIAAELMALDKDAEQVGFLENPQENGAKLRLQMMGGEFCGNASISAAVLYASRNGIDDGDVLIEVSGAQKPLSVSITRRSETVFEGSVNMPLPQSIGSLDFCGAELPVVNFDGISHIINEGKLSRECAEKSVAAVCKKHGFEALGIMFLDGDRLEPFVYVSSTETAVWESSCASGTAAVAAYKAQKAAESQSVKLNQQGGRLTVNAQYVSGGFTSLLLTGNAEIVGRHLICT